MFHLLKEKKMDNTKSKKIMHKWNTNKEIETIKNQIEILELKYTIIKLKDLLELFENRLNHTKEKKSVNLKTVHLKLPR